MNERRSSTSQRIPGIDAARGAAMLLVCLSHFAHTAFVLESGIPARQLLVYASMIASPTFMLISGMMVGMLYETRRAEFGRIARSLAGRGIFLLTVGHALIILAISSVYDTFGNALKVGLITDVIAVAVIGGPFLMRRVGVRGRLYLSGAIMICAVAMSIMWLPTTSFGAAVRYVLAGPWDSQMTMNFALLPWLAVYLSGSALGEWMAGLHMSGRRRALELGFVGLGITTAGVAVLATFTHKLLGGSAAIASITSLGQKFPPSPAYIAFFGGCGMVMIGFLLFADRRQIPMLMGWLRMLGRTSLFVFILQFYVYYLGFKYVSPTLRPWWPLVFVLSLITITGCAWVWDKAGWNRWYNVLDWFAPAARPVVASQDDPVTVRHRPLDRLVG